RREVLEGLLRRLARRLLLLAALGDLARDVLPRRAPLVGEAERHDRRAVAAPAAVEVLLDVGQLGARQRRRVVEDVVVAGGLLALAVLLAADDDRPRVDLDDPRALGGLATREIAGQIGGDLGRPRDDLLLLVVDEVVLA